MHLRSTALINLLSPPIEKISCPVNCSRLKVHTTWFGGTDASGLAIEGGVWDFEDNTLQSIGDTMNVCAARASQIRREAVLRLRRALGERLAS